MGSPSPLRLPAGPATAARPPRRRRHAAGVLLSLAGLASAAGLAACSSSPTPDGAAFCQGVREHLTELSGGVTSPASVDTVLARYRDLEALAPVAVRDEWAQVRQLLEAAATLPPGDQAAAAKFADQAATTKAQVDAVTEWVKATCGVDLAGPTTPATTAALLQGPTTTAPPPTTTKG